MRAFSVAAWASRSFRGRRRQSELGARPFRSPPRHQDEPPTRGFSVRFPSPRTPPDFRTRWTGSCSRRSRCSVGGAHAGAAGRLGGENQCPNGSRSGSQEKIAGILTGPGDRKYLELQDFERAGDGTRTRDVQLGKEAERQALSGLRANSPLRTRCSVRRSPSTCCQFRHATGPGLVLGHVTERLRSVRNDYPDRSRIVPFFPPPRHSGG
jgi:hypothetical protein